MESCDGGAEAVRVHRVLPPMPMLCEYSPLRRQAGHTVQLVSRFSSRKRPLSVCVRIAFVIMSQSDWDRVTTFARCDLEAGFLRSVVF
jgi:hypothetical protein